MITSQKMFRMLWILLALTFPLFGIDYLRIRTNIYDFAVPMIVMGLIVILAFFDYCIFSSPLSKPLFREADVILLFLGAMFALVHLVGFLSSIDKALATSEFAKLILGLICFTATVVFFPRDKDFAEKFWITLLWSSAILVSYFIYVYGFVFRSYFMGTELRFAAKVGKNQLSWYLSVIIPFVYAHCYASRKPWLSAIPMVVLSVAILYISSRGAWVTLLLGMMSCATLFIFSDFFNRTTSGFVINARVLMGLMLSAAAGLLILSQFIELTDMQTRFLYIFNPDVAPELKSYDARMLAVKEAWEGFMTSPFLGVGFTNTDYFATRITHDDYVGILLELGLPGIVCFLSIFICVAVRMKINFKRFSWLSYGAWGGFLCIAASLIFINIYTSVHFWILLGFFVAAVDTDRERAQLEYELEKRAFLESENKTSDSVLLEA